MFNTHDPVLMKRRKNAKQKEVLFSKEQTKANSGKQLCTSSRIEKNSVFLIRQEIYVNVMFFFKVS